MNLELNDEQGLLRATFERLFAEESSADRVRSAEATGFDAALWKHLVEAGLFGLRVPADERGGADGSLLDAAIVAHEAGRRLASGPLLEQLVAARILASSESPVAREWLSRLLSGDAIVSIAFRDLRKEPRQLIAGGSVADAILARDGEMLVVLTRPEPPDDRPANLGAQALAYWSREDCGVEVLGEHASDRALVDSAIEEWKLLTAAALAGLGREALEIAARYATERIQFDRPIATFQGVAHPLAESAAEIEGARYCVWKTIEAIAKGAPDAAALVSICFAWASEAATRAASRALHVHGGYGLSLEYDIQLYYRRAKAWGLTYGDPQQELARIADRLWSADGAARVALPPAGDITLDFGLGEAAEAMRERARRFFEENLDDELRAHAHFAWEGHHPGIQRKLAEAELLFPAWPRAYGGQGRDPYEMAALREVLQENGWTMFAISVTNMIAMSLMEFATEELKREVLPRIARGDAIASLGYSEPGSGSDVAAAQTRAVRDGDDWIINGQKMFTSGANLAQYVFLLTRTDTRGRKHEGLTMFLVPLDTPGIDVQAIETLSDERTNATYYQDVRVPDRYRVGEVDGGWTVMSSALAREHGGGHSREQKRLVEAALEWARHKEVDGGLAIDQPRIRERIARAAMHAAVSEALGAAALYSAAERKADPSIGPMARTFSTDRFTADAADLMDLCAPDSLLQGRPGGQQRGAAGVEFRYRLSAATSIYGGTTEIMKSIIAQASLGLPRSRS